MIRDGLFKIHGFVVCIIAVVNIWFDVFYLRIILGVITFTLSIFHLLDIFETSCKKRETATSPIQSNSPFSDVQPYPIQQIQNIKYPNSPVFPARIIDETTVPAP